jgi:hypothetical protein
MSKRKQHPKQPTLEQAITYGAKNFAALYAYQTFAKSQRLPLVHMAMDDTGYEIWNTVKVIIQSDYHTEPSEDLRVSFQTQYERYCIETYQGIEDGSIDIQQIENFANDGGFNLGLRIITKEQTS